MENLPTLHYSEGRFLSPIYQYKLSIEFTSKCVDYNRATNSYTFEINCLSSFEGEDLGVKYNYFRNSLIVITTM